MKKKLTALAVLGLFIFSGSPLFAETGKDFHKKQREEKREFHKSLKGMKPEDRLKAIQDQKAKRFQEDQDFLEKKRAEAQDRLKQRLSKKTDLTDAQKAEILNRANEKYQEKIDFNKKQHEANAAFLNQLNADTSLTKKARKEAMKKHREEMRAARKAHKTEMREKYKDLKDWKKEKK